jgi:transcriptional regulator with XRE-family HTH domain
MDKKTVGQRIRELREARKLTQQQLAKSLGIKQGSLTQLETGKSKAPASTTLTKLARVFEVDPEWLMTGRGNQQPISSLGEDESELVLLFRSLSQEGRQYVLGRARSVHRDEHESHEREENASSRASPSRKGAGH